MVKKLLVIFGIAAVAGYLFRDRLAAAALELVGKVSSTDTFDDLKADILARVEELRIEKE